jgi:hypothetical protein
MKFNLLLISIFLTIIIYAEINHETGMINSTKLNGEGCICHNQYYNDSVYVWIEGPDSVFIGDTVQFKLFMTGGPAVAGGFNIATYFGILNSIDTTTQVISGELTHTMPKPFVNDTATWNFLYTTPDSIVTDTLYSVANSVNGNGNPTLDEWNFGENFAINVIDQPVDLKNNRLHPADFELYQNYPNPFNPSTKIKFNIPFTLSEVEGAIMTLKVYDVLGNEIAILVNEEKVAGEYEVEFSARNITSGIYFYKLSSRGFSETKKMILMK